MAEIIRFPTPKTKEESSFDLYEFLNRHTGCDFRKADAGDPEEIKKMERHFQKETLRIRSKYLNEPSDESDGE